MNVVDFLDRSEEQLAAHFSDALANDGVLQMGAQLWRTGLAGVAALQPAMRNIAPPPLPREALFGMLRTGWSFAAYSCGLFALAQRIEKSGLPAFEPTPTHVAHVTSDYQLRYVAGDGEPLLVLSSMINRWYILDLQHEHSFLAMLRRLGRPIYVLEWLPAKPADDRSFADIIAGPIRGAVEWICAAHGTSTLSLLGYSMGGTLAACFTARFPDRVARLATVCTPVRFDNAGMFTRWLAPDLVDINLVASAWDRVPSQLVHLPFWYLHPTVKMRKLVVLARSFERPGYLEHFFATETWNHDNVDLARGVFRSWLGLYQNSEIISELANIRCPKLVISGASDNITPPACAEALQGARILRVDAGHVGVLTSRRALKAQAAALSTWLGEAF